MVEEVLITVVTVLVASLMAPIESAQGASSGSLLSNHLNITIRKIFVKRQRVNATSLHSETLISAALH